MFQYHYLNKISDKGSALWTKEYEKQMILKKHRPLLSVVLLCTK